MPQNDFKWRCRHVTRACRSWPCDRHLPSKKSPTSFRFSQPLQEMDMPYIFFLFCIRGPSFAPLDNKTRLCYPVSGRPFLAFLPSRLLNRLKAALSSAPCPAYTWRIGRNYFGIYTRGIEVIDHRLDEGREEGRGEVSAPFCKIWVVALSAHNVKR